MKHILISLSTYLVSLLCWAGVDHGNPSAKYINPVFLYEISYNSFIFKIDESDPKLIKLEDAQRNKVVTILSTPTTITNVQDVSNQVDVSGCTETVFNSFPGYQCTNRLVLLYSGNTIFDINHTVDSESLEIVDTFAITKRDLIPYNLKTDSKADKIYSIPNSTNILIADQLGSGKPTEWEIRDSQYNLVRKLNTNGIDFSYDLARINLDGSKILLFRWRYAFAIFDTQTGQKIYSYKVDELKGPYLNSVEFGTDEKSLFTSYLYNEGFDKFDIGTSQFVQHYSLPGKEKGLRLNVDVKNGRLLIRPEDKIFYAWDLKAGKVVWSLDGDYWLRGLAPDGRLLLEAALPYQPNEFRSQLELWSLGQQKPDHVYLIPDNRAEATMGAKYFATVDHIRNSLQIWSYENNKERPPYFEDSEELITFVFTDTGDELWGRTTYGYPYAKSKILKWKLEDKRQLKRIDFKYPVSQVLVPKNNPNFYTVDVGCRIEVFNKTSKNWLETFPTQHCAYSAELSKDGQRLYVVSNEKNTNGPWRYFFSIYNLVTKTQIRSIEIPLDIQKDGTAQVRISPDESTIYWPYRYCLLRQQLSDKEAECVYQMDVNTYLNSVQISADGSTILIQDGEVYGRHALFLNTKKLTVQKEIHFQGNLKLYGSSQAFQYWGEDIQIFNWQTDQILQKIAATPDSVFSPDWIHRPTWINDIQFSMDGQNLIVLKVYGVEIFDLKTRQLKATYRGHYEAYPYYTIKRTYWSLSDVAQMSSTELVTVGIDGTLRFWTF